jgi:hypothetical protein
MNGNFTKIDTAYGQLKDLLLAKTGKDNLKDAIEYVEQLVNAHDATITADKVLNGYVGYSGLERIEGTALAKEITAEATNLLNGKTMYDHNGELITGSMPNFGTTGRYVSGEVSGSAYRLYIDAAGYYDNGAYLVRDKNDVLNDIGVKTVPTINVTCDSSSTYVSSYGAGINGSGTLVIWVMTGSTSYEHVYFYPASIVGTKGFGWDISAWDTNDPVGCYACTVNGLGSYSTINVDLKYNSVNNSYDYVQLNVTITAS